MIHFEEENEVILININESKRNSLKFHCFPIYATNKKINQIPQITTNDLQ